MPAKCHLPKRGGAHVNRPRLDQRLGAVLRTALTLVSAPAGLGKTSALTQWLAAVPASAASVAWLSLDSRDNDPALSAS